MKYEIEYSSRFKKDYKLIKKRGYDLSLLRQVVTMLANVEKLPERYYDHDLKGNYAGHRECHITPDWLLIYKIENDILVLGITRTGTHSDLF
ncbi:MAG: type II toxin-antitoxin system YafQ family toxin [Candidatus Ornithomonoglobus sp.]